MNKILLGILLFLNLVTISNADELDTLYEYALPTLNGAQNFKEHKGNAVAILIFQPNCSWCALQSRTIHKMQKNNELSDRYLAVGINGRKSALVNEVFKTGLKLPAYQSTGPFIAKAELDKSSPVMLILNQKGQLLKKLVGYQDKTVLKQIDNFLSKI